MRQEDIPEQYRRENVKGWRFIVPDEVLYGNIHDSNAVLEWMKRDYEIQKELRVHNDSQLSEVSRIMAKMGRESLSENNEQ